MNLSDLTKIISGYQLNILSSIYMYGDCELKIDCNMEKEVFSGKNIVLLTENYIYQKGLIQSTYLVRMQKNWLEKVLFTTE